MKLKSENHLNMDRFTAIGLEFATKRVNGSREDEGHEIQRPGKNHQKRLGAGGHGVSVKPREHFVFGTKLF